MIRYIKTFEVIFSINNLSGMHISTMWHSWNVYKYFCPLSVQKKGYRTFRYRQFVIRYFVTRQLVTRHFVNNMIGQFEHECYCDNLILAATML